MTFLAPLGLLALASLPVLVWLWRMTSNRRRFTVPSLIPFEHLLQRQSRQRNYIVVNILFWLQLLILIALSLALAQPAIVQSHPTVTIAILDTSASMQASEEGTTRLAQAKGLLLAHMARRAWTDQFLVVTTAPLAALVTEPTGDIGMLTRVVSEAPPSDMRGDLSSAVRFGIALLGQDPSRIVVATDEPKPASLGSRIQWMHVGTPRPNVALIGVETPGSFCAPTDDTRVLVHVRNTAASATSAMVSLRQSGQRVAQQPLSLEPQASATAELSVPSGVQGWTEVAVDASHDALEADNHAWIELGRSTTMPLVVQSDRPAFVQTVSAWLSACPTAHWTEQIPAGTSSFVLITDRPSPWPSAAALIAFAPSTTARPVVSAWLTAFAHPVAAYVNPLERVTAMLSSSASFATAGTPVMTALVEGQRQPLVLVDERNGRRSVFMNLDPVGTPSSTSLLLVVFNSLRWVLEPPRSLLAGQPIVFQVPHAGSALVRGPDGRTETLPATESTIQKGTAARAGLYQITQDQWQATIGVNLFDPLESDLLNPVSTWRPIGPSDAAIPRKRATPARQPLAPLLMGGALLILLMEWWLYSAKRQQRPQSTVDSPQNGRSGQIRPQKSETPSSASIQRA